MNDSELTWEQAVSKLRSQSDRAQLVKDCFFDDPLMDAALRYYESSEWSAVRELIGLHGGAALDIGAGRGISSLALARDGWRVTALEPDPSNLVGAGAIRDLASAAGVDIGVVEDWGEALPFGDQTFDLVYGRQVLHHARDLAAFCREIGRVLKPGGILLATREHVISRDADLDKFLRNHPLHNLYGGEHAYKLHEYKNAIRGGGIRIQRVFNPWASPINMYPKSIGDVAEAIHSKLPLVPAKLLSPTVLSQLGRLHRSPGAAYSFLGVRDAS